MSKHNLKAVFFDLDETLIKNNIPIRALFPKVFFDFIDVIGEEHKLIFFNTLQNQVKGLWTGMFESKINPEQQLVNCFIKTLNKTGAVHPVKVPSLAKQMVAHFIDLAANNIELHDGAIETLEGLQQRDISIGLITNGLVSIQSRKIASLNLEPYFDTITISAEARAHKPDKPIFDLALKRSAVTADQAWFVGDHITNDIAGARRAGIHSIYYNPHKINVESSFAPVLERPDYTINSLTEILEFL